MARFSALGRERWTIWVAMADRERDVNEEFISVKNPREGDREIKGFGRDKIYKRDRVTQITPGVVNNGVINISLCTSNFLKPQVAFGPSVFQFLYFDFL